MWYMAHHEVALPQPKPLSSRNQGVRICWCVSLMLLDLNFSISLRCESEQIIGIPKETGRLILSCEATLEVMRKCFDLLGMKHVY